MPVLQEEKPVKAIEDLGRRLMDCAYYSFVIGSSLHPQHINDFKRRRTVKSTRWLITKKQIRVSYQFIPDAGSFTLSTGYALY